MACEKCNVWQHSACLSISQTDAEKDDFHFICQDCKRREEDAKKPKIPSLKFHIGSSSSPPQQKPKVVIPGANEGKKRKSSEERSQLPPSKKFKPVHSNNHHPQNAYPPRASQNGQNGMHASVMNGPTLSPQGQLPRQSVYAGNQEESFFTRRAYPEAPPPGLRSPPGPPAYANGYNNHASSPNGYVPQLPPQAFQSPYANGAYQGSQQNQNVGWSARYTSPQQSQHAPAYGPLPPSQNPFTTSLDRQRPPSSHSTHNVPSPVKNGPSLSPPHQQPPQYQTPHTNGTRPSQSLAATRLPALSPVKQQSPPAASHTIRLPPSSPSTQKPPLQNNAPSSPGLSPTKQSPPRAAPSLGVAGSPAVLPPVAQLSPSPMQQSLSAALKSATPD